MINSTHPPTHQKELSPPPPPTTPNNKILVLCHPHPTPNIYVNEMINIMLSSVARLSITHQWGIEFNPDPTKQAAEVIFSCKESSPHHTDIIFNGTVVTRNNDLGLIPESKLSFEKHLNGTVVTRINDLGLILFLFYVFLSRDYWIRQQKMLGVHLLHELCSPGWVLLE